jgi:hypothetical protein
MPLSLRLQEFISLEQPILQVILQALRQQEQAQQKMSLLQRWLWMALPLLQLI